MVALIALSFGVLSGCARTGALRDDIAAQPHATPRVAWESDPADAPWPVVRAAWRDVWAAVNWAASNSGHAVTDVEEPSPLERVYTLVGVDGGWGEVRFTASRLVENALPSDPWVSFEVRVGALGHGAKEATIRADLLRYRPRHAR